MSDQRMQHNIQATNLADILERVLDKGVVIAGDIKIKLCDIELLSIQIRLLIASVDKAREMGLTWWWQSPEQQQPPHYVPRPQAAPAGLPAQAPAEDFDQLRRQSEQLEKILSQPPKKQKGNSGGQNTKGPTKSRTDR